MTKTLVMTQAPVIEVFVRQMLMADVPPKDIEHAVIHELQRQTASTWYRTNGGMGWGGDWYQLPEAQELEEEQEEENGAKLNSQLALLL